VKSINDQSDNLYNQEADNILLIRALTTVYTSRLVFTAIIYVSNFITIQFYNQFYTSVAVSRTEVLHGAYKATNL